MSNKYKIAVVGLGYVGMPLALEFSKKYSVLGFDINKTRIDELSKGEDRTREADPEEIKKALARGSEAGSAQAMSIGLSFSHNEEDLNGYNVFIVTVPTPIDDFKVPDLKPLKGASATIGRHLKKGDIVIYESTVYPGCTEEECVPVLEQVSGLKFNQDFFCGYSPERINPGDKVNTLTKIKKVTSGSTPEIAVEVDNLYKSIITAGTHLAPNMKVAEASKAIENAQRDVNISFVNELSLIFERLGIDTSDVIEAAGTKWNFLKYKPGLVGGHCIGVDPYYLAHKAESVGYYPQVILSGRRINDSMGVFVANRVIKLMIGNGHKIKGEKVLVLGVTFKENCPDIRNTKVKDVVNELKQFQLKVDVYDPWADPKEVEEEYGIKLIPNLEGKKYNAIILTVSHNEFLSLEYDKLKEEDAVVFDTKSFLPREITDGRL
ncbi:MAG: nucleotide sugar dehydrogenase [Bacteroidetes bacterium]|nr:nucleotide sugar dehydrogenase [Bacteroidota bacterium]